MLGTHPQGPDQDAVPEVAVSTRRGLSIVWLIPLVAIAIAGWLAYTTLQDQGPTITITFKTAEGLEPGKTKVMYKNVAMGEVDQVQLSADLSTVTVTVDMDKSAAPHLGSRTKFWVVRPRIGTSGVSGLGTLVSGAYIEMDPGGGEPTIAFTGLEVPPLVLANEPGRRFILRADDRGSISAGSPIYFRGIKVGQVLRDELTDDRRGVRIHIFVRAPHDLLIQDHSRFWNAGGFRMSVNADGFDVQTASLESLLVGGIEFDTPLTAQPAEPSAADTVFPLFPDQASVTESTVTEAYPFIVHFQGSVRGLKAGAPVEFRGLRIGTVRQISVEVEPETLEIRIPVVLEIEPQRVSRVRNQLAGAAEGQLPPDEFIGLLVERGLRAQLRSGNLLTGELLVALDFHPDAKPAKLEFGGVYPEIPAVPSTIDALTASVSSTLNKLAALPLDDLIVDARKVLATANALLDSDDAKATIAGLSQSVQKLDTLLGDLQRQTGPMLSQAQATLANTQSLTAPDSQLRYDLNALLRELSGAARSIRVFAEYLERNPDALIRASRGGR